MNDREVFIQDNKNYFRTDILPSVLNSMTFYRIINFKIVGFLGSIRVRYLELFRLMVIVGSLDNLNSRLVFQNFCHFVGV